MGGVEKGRVEGVGVEKERRSWGGWRVLGGRGRELWGIEGGS